MKHIKFYTYSIFAVVIFLLLLSVYWVGRSASESYYQTVTVFYPFLALFHSGIFHVVGFSLMICLELIIWKMASSRLTKGVILIIAIGVVTLLFMTVWQFITHPHLENRDEIKFQDNLYYLTLNSGYILGQDCDLTAYVIYKCDQFGLICQSFSTPYLDSYQDTQCTGQLTKSDIAHFMIDDLNTLSVQISDEKSIVETGK